MGSSRVASRKMVATIKKIEVIQEMAGSLSTLIGKADDFRQAINRAKELRGAADSFIKLIGREKHKKEHK